MPFVIGTAGHVDHGKSSLVFALTGIDPDRLSEEKAREMTIDLGFAWFTLPGGQTVGIIDVPGHRDFIDNMLAGIGGIDLALLVVAADEGVMPQTREHIAILSLLGVRNAIVVLTKCDLIEDEEWLDLINLDIAVLLQSTPMAGAPVLPVSSHTGAGLPALIAAIEARLTESPPRLQHRQPSLSIDRVFTVSGFGTVVTGTLTGGMLALGTEVAIQPRNLRARVRGLQSYQQPVTEAQPGSRVAVNLAGVDVADIRRGDLLCLPGSISHTTMVDVSFQHLADAPYPLRHNSLVKFYSRAAEVTANIRLLGQHELAPGEEGWLQICFHQPLALEQHDRYILRYPSPAETIGGGLILDVHPPHRWRRFKPEVMQRMMTLSIGSPADRAMASLEGSIVLTTGELSRTSGLGMDELQAVIGTLVQDGRAIALSDSIMMSAFRWQQIKQRSLEELAAYHSTNPLRGGMPREALRSRLGLDTRLFNLLLARLSADTDVIEDGSLLRLSDFRVAFTEKQQQAIEALFDQIEANPYVTPHIKDATVLVGADVMSALIEQGKLVSVSEDVFFDADTYYSLVTHVREHIALRGSITVAEARDLFNTSRKYALALLEHLDAAGITIRNGDIRILGGQPRRPAP